MNEHPEDAYAIGWRLREATAALDWHLELFGNDLAEREGYAGLRGMEAITLYLVKTYRWTPATIEAMSGDHLRLVLSQELAGWTMPEAAMKYGPRYHGG